MFDPMENDVSDTPDFDKIDDEAFAPLPPPFSPGQGDPFGNGEDEGELSKLPEVPAAKRKGVRRPQPKLDSQRLTSEKGLPALRHMFDNVKFKGKGHEVEDLNVLMQKMENWAHRLYPKLQFEDFVDKLETLGTKKEVQTCLKRIRMDMPLTHEDFISKEGEENIAPEDVYVSEDLDPFRDEGFPKDSPRLVHSTPAPPSLTEEQQRRIELNKQLALEKRLARMQQHTDASGSQPASLSLAANEPSTSSSSHISGQQSDEESAGNEDSCRDQNRTDFQKNSSPQKATLLSTESHLCEKDESSQSHIPQISNGFKEDDD
ncbi:TIMELESS-interacting protein [Aplochiton taeniatus]